MDEQLYRDIILEHWRNPLNYGVIDDADIQVKDYNPLCGDEIYLTAKVQNGMIENIQFISTGCVISKASASILTEYAKQKPKVDMQNLTQEKFLQLLEIKLTAGRLTCALLSYAALQKGLKKVS